MRARRLSDERGIALAVAVFALVVIGALVAGTFFVGRLEQQTGQNTFYVAQAAEAAQAGIERALVEAKGATYDAMVAGANPTPLSSLVLTGNLTATRTVQRLTNSLWIIRAVGSRANAGYGGVQATRKLASLVRLNKAPITVNAGLTAIGDVEVFGNATVSGNDAVPPSWASGGVECPPTSNKTGILYNGTLNTGGSSEITGAPRTLEDPTLTADNMLGGSTFEQLKALRTMTLIGNVSGLAPVTIGDPPRCDASVQSNWGAPTDPASPCFNYFPIIYHYGDLSLSGSGAGQGILLVEGNLNAQGRIDFYGPVIVTGEVNVRGTGGDDVKFYGGIIAQNVALDDNRLTGNATVSYSSCAIRRAINGSASLMPLAERSWAQVYDY
jgi:hypothetical protein